MTPNVKDRLEDAVLKCVLRRGIHRMSPRQVAETMMRIPDHKIEAAARKLEAEAAWLRGWKSGSTLPAEPSDGIAAARPLGIGQRDEGGCRDAEQ